MLVRNRIKTAFRRGVLGARPPEAEDFLKKNQKNGGFSFMILLFGRAP